MNNDFLKTADRRDGHVGPLITEPISRRSFIQKSALWGASAMLAGSAFGWMRPMAFAEPKVDIAAVKGSDYYKSTIKAVEILGGMGKFVSKQSRVGLLINSPWQNPGSFVNPAITLAVVHMCLGAGAKEVGVFKSLGNAYWRRSALAEKFPDELKGIRYIGGNYTEAPIPGGRSLKKAEISKGLLDCDVLINIPIAKDHDGVRFTGTMKNMMGATSGSTNMFFHRGSGASGYYDDVEFLAQCIADVNLLRKPDLCVFDGTELITTNGPSGPGNLIKPQIVFAGLDRVAADAYGASLLGLRGEEILTTRMAHAHGLGELSLSSLQIEEVTL